MTLRIGLNTLLIATWWQQESAPTQLLEASTESSVMVRAYMKTAAPDARATNSDSSDRVTRHERVLHETYRIRRGVLTQFAQRLTRSRVEAEDLVQQAFLGAFERELPISGDELFGWLTTVIRRLAVDRQRRSAVHLRYAELQRASSIHLEEPWTMEDLDGWIRKLPIGLRCTFKLWCAGASYQAIALTQHLPIGTVSARVQRAKLQVRALCMAEQG